MTRFRTDKLSLVRFHLPWFFRLGRYNTRGGKFTSNLWRGSIKSRVFHWTKDRLLKVSFVRGHSNPPRSREPGRRRYPGNPVAPVHFLLFTYQRSQWPLPEQRPNFKQQPKKGKKRTAGHTKTKRHNTVRRSKIRCLTEIKHVRSYQLRPRKKERVLPPWITYRRRSEWVLFARLRRGRGWSVTLICWRGPPIAAFLSYAMLTQASQPRDK